jgi:hypothetical protein
MKTLKIILLSLTSTLLFSCGETPEEVYDYQMFYLEDCIICKDPFQQVETVEEMVSSLNSIKNEYGENTDTVSGFLMFDDIEIVNPPAGKDYSRFRIPYYYSSPNCWTEPRRRGSLTVDLNHELLKQNSKGWDLFLKSKDGDKFDLFVLDPVMKYTHPDHACDGTSFSIYEYRGMLLVPKEVIINGTVDYELLDKY